MRIAFRVEELQRRTWKDVKICWGGGYNRIWMRCQVLEADFPVISDLRFFVEEDVLPR